jgi:lipoate-protein ligase A
LTGHRSRLETLAFGAYEAEYNMALDLHLFTLSESGAECGFLRFYTWSEPTLSLGRFEDRDVIDVARAREDGVGLVRRPTGGRVVLHCEDLTYAVAVSRSAGRSPLESYRMISECVASGIARLGIEVRLERSTGVKSEVRRKPCFVSTSRYEVLCRGRKIAGSAQKVGKAAVLQHGSIPLGRGYLRVVDYMASGRDERAKLLRDLTGATCCLHDLMGSRPAPEEVAEALTRGFAGRFELVESRLDPGRLCPALGDAAHKA